MKLIKSKKFHLALFLFIFVFTFILRAHNYERVPTSNHLDEMLYAWSGLYLIETGVPVSWSTLNYPKRAEVFKGIISYKGGKPDTSVTLYKPWLDEPPLFSLIVGSVAHWYGAARTEFVPSSYIRIPVILFAALTSIMIFLIARLVSGYWTGILSMLIYGTTPLMVFASRTAMPENLIALLFTIMIYLLLKFNQIPKLIYILPIPLLVGIAGLSKPTGYFLVLLAIYWVFKKLFETKKPQLAFKYCLYLLLGTLPFVFFYFWYGMHFDKEIFEIITAIQSHRPTGFNSLAYIFTTPAYHTLILTDGWYVFGLLSAIYFLFNPFSDIKRMISLSFVFWIIVVMISGGETDLLPWYRFPAFPMLAILAAWGLQLIVQRADFFVSFLAAGLLLGNRLFLVNAFRPNIDTFQYRIIFSSLIFPSLLRSIFATNWLEKLSRTLIIGVAVVGIYINVIYIYNAYEIECESKTCPMVPSTTLSSLYFPVIWKMFVLGEPTYK